MNMCRPPLSAKPGWIVAGIVFLFFLPEVALGQYFGQNKMRYKKLNFEVRETPHFELYTYLKNDSMVSWLAKEAEVWYELHQQVFQDTFLRKNPLIVYNNHPEFQQTSTISGEISVGTGGVTEAFKQRVVMPVMQINQQTRHVLGHELVHAFQYRILIEGRDTTRLESVANIPLWMVEGMAEYFSIGKKDAFTAMWMRDAYARRDIPSLRQLTEQSYNYFPYRYGQAFWAFIGATYGDTVIMPLFMETAKYGYEYAMRRVFGYDAQTMSTLWRNSMETTFRSLNKDTAARPIGQALITPKNGGRMNVSPSISRDGRLVAFMSEKDLFGIDLFLADAQTGEIVQKLGSRMASDIDEFSYLESAGDFSPDGNRFAFSVFNEGKNKLMIIDVRTGKKLSVEAMGDIVEFTNIAFAPDGERVAFSGLKEGQSDLYIYNLKTKQLEQLTNDRYSDFQPSFSPDGKRIVFSTDRVAYASGARPVDIPMGLAILDLESRKISTIDVFPGANNLNPHFSGDGRMVYFLSNGDGYRNMFRYALETHAVERMTDFFTGISGITEYSPAMSIARNDDIVYSFFRGNQYNIYKANASEFQAEPFDASVCDFTAAMLPPNLDRGVNVVNTNLQNFNLYGRIGEDRIRPVQYRPKFKLDYLANSGVGMMVGSRYGAGMSGGIFGIFSDILGYNQIYSTLSINGEIYDFGGQVAYVNQKGRWNWGGALSHVPYMSSFSVFDQRTLANNINEPVLDTYLIRTFQQQADAFVAYPFNRSHRFEMGGGVARHSYRVDRWSQGYYTGYAARDRISNTEAGNMLGASFSSFFIQQVNAGFVGDNSIFGIGAPILGFRYRLGAEQYVGDYNFTAYNLDLRRYFRFKPVTLALRGYSYMRTGKDDNKLYPMYIGYPFFVRGYENSSQENIGKLNINDLMGSRTAVGNIELRLPFTGPEKIAALPSDFFYSDLNLFFDAGLAWNRGSKIVGNLDEKPRVPQVDRDGKIVVDANNNPILGYDPNYRVPVFSAGVSLRVNLFGAMILEPYYAVPFISSRTNFGTFGLNFMPGW